MPATSKAQQRLMGMAYAYKKGELDAKEASQEVKDLADSMTLKQLKKYASTKHEGLPDKVDDNLQPGDVGGMGPIKFPSATDVGSGDVPAGQGDAEEEYKKKRRKMKHLKNFESFLNESVNEAMSFQDLVNKYKDNPYGIGANSIEYIESENWGNQLVLRFEDSYSRKETEAELKKMGIKAKKMSKSTADKAFKYRYELRVFESVNEASVVELSELTSAQQKQIKTFESIIGGKCETIWDDIHGFIVAIKLQNQMGSYRFDTDTMKKLISAKVRWVEEDLGSRINIGF